MERRPIALATALLLLAAPMLAMAADKGVIYLDDLSFDKVVNSREDVLVKFDRERPWGLQHEVWQDLVVDLLEVDAPITFAGVGINNQPENLVNPKLARRYGLEDVEVHNELPRLMLFRRHADTRLPMVYTGDFKQKEIVDWLKEMTGAFIGTKGQVEHMDAAAKKLVAAAKGDRKKIVEEAAATANTLKLTPAQKDYVEYYIKTFNRVLDKGIGYVRKETERLDKMAGDPGVTFGQRDVFQWKMNVLSSFAKESGALPKKDEL